MTAQAAANIVGEMHLRGVTAKKLAEELGWHPKYLSRVINCHVNPPGAEEKIKSALKTITGSRHDGAS